MTLLLFLMAVASSAGIFYLTGLYTVWYFYFIPILLLVPTYWLSFVLLVLTVGFIGLFFNKKKEIKRPYGYFYWVTCNCIRQVMRFLRVKVKITGIEKLPEESFVAVYNHRSVIDPFVLMTRLPVKRIVMISKPENEKIPVVGKYMHYSGFLTIDRRSPKNARVTVERSAAWVRENIASVAISPEGTRSKSGKLLAFRAAPFSTAKKAEAPLVVTTMVNTEKVFKRFPWRSTTIDLHIVGVISPDTLLEMSSFDLSNHVRQMMLDDLGEEDSLPPAKSPDEPTEAES